jgi:hypothetical protein
LFDLRARVRWRDGVADPAHHRQVDKVIGHVADLLVANARASLDLLKHLELVGGALVDDLDSQLPRPHRGRLRVAPEINAT